MRTLTSPQLTELEAFWYVEGGWGDYKDDYRNAQALCMQANINRDSKRRPQPYTAEDFVMRPKQPKDVNNLDAERRIRARFDALAGVKAKKRRKAKKGKSQ